MTMAVRFAIVVSLAACTAGQPWGRAHVVAPSSEGGRSIDIAASRTEFAPDRVRVHLGETVHFRFTRTAERTCAREVVVSLDAKHRIRRDLPVGIPVEITLVFDEPGELGFTCGMEMLGGTIEVAR